jgi:hypothetical protein
MLCPRSDFALGPSWFVHHGTHCVLYHKPTSSPCRYRGGSGKSLATVVPALPPLQLPTAGGQSPSRWTVDGGISSPCLNPWQDISGLDHGTGTGRRLCVRRIMDSRAASDDGGQSSGRCKGSRRWRQRLGHDDLSHRADRPTERDLEQIAARMW